MSCGISNKNPERHENQIQDPMCDMTDFSEWKTQNPQNAHIKVNSHNKVYN